MDAPTWNPGPDGWERAKRKALAEEGIEHLRRMKRAMVAHANARRRAVARLIAGAGGNPDAEAPPEVEGEDDEEEWRAEAARMIRKRRQLFEDVAEDGHAPLPPERRELLLRGGLTPEQLMPWPSMSSLQRRVEEVRRWRAIAEDAAP